MMTDYLFTLFGSTSIRLRDILDIAIVAYAIYLTFSLIRGTIATQMVLAVGILFALFKVSDPQYLDLKTLHWLMGNFWTIALLGSIILFQPEIRRGLTKIGQQRLFRRAIERDEVVITEVSNTVEVLSNSRIGALIVFERENGLEPIREMGQALDAEVSRELLHTIFFPNSPLHDGAVIIKDCRIAAAGCFLPLSKNPYLSSSFGTRHRAAIGVTEETDAVVVVVSEETGTISSTLGGHLQVHNSAEELKKRLLELYDLSEG